MSSPIELTDEQKEQIVSWFVSHLPTGEEAAAAASDAGRELDKVDEVLVSHGWDYPRGARGVRDAINQYEGRLEDAENELKENEGVIKALRGQRDRAEAKLERVASLIHDNRLGLSRLIPATELKSALEDE